MMEITLALDMGGTYIKAALLDAHGRIWPGSESIHPARASEPQGALLDHLHGVMAAVLRHAPPGA